MIKTVFDRHVHEHLGQEYHHRPDVLRCIPGDVQSFLLDVTGAGNHHHRYCVCILNVGSRSGYNHLSYDGAAIESWLEPYLSSSSSIGISVVNSSLFIDLALQIRCALELFLISLSISSPCVPVVCSRSWSLFIRLKNSPVSHSTPTLDFERNLKSPFICNKTRHGIEQRHISW